MKISQNGIKLITSFEGCRLSAYQDSVGVWTIGYGHTSGVYPGMMIDKDTAEVLLKEDITKFEQKVRKYDSIYHWGQNQFDALVSYAYNIGSIDKLVNKGKRTIEEISEDIPNHNKAKGTVLPGLTRRRLAEKTLFDKDIIYSAEGGCYPKCVEKYNSLVDGLNSLHIDSSKNHRILIAKANGIDNYIGTADQNIQLLSLLKSGKLKRE